MKSNTLMFAFLFMKESFYIEKVKTKFEIIDLSDLKKSGGRLIHF